MCPTETKLLRLLAGELPQAERQRLQTHLAECGICAARYRSLEGVWADLGQWQATPPRRDLTGAVLAAAVQQDRRARWYARGGLAAALLLAAGLGWTIGRLPAQPATHSAVSTEQLAQELGLDTLGGDLELFQALFAAEATPDNPVQGGQS